MTKASFKNNSAAIAMMLVVGVSGGLSNKTQSPEAAPAAQLLRRFTRANEKAGLDRTETLSRQCRRQSIDDWEIAALEEMEHSLRER
jgi:hypothetical protein